MTSLCQRLGRAVLVAALAAALGLGLQGPSAAAEEEDEAAAQQSATFDEVERQAIERLVRRYILEHPEIIVEAVQTLQAREREKAAERRREALAAHKEALTTSDLVPVLGNPQGDVTVVEFFDYRCPYCRNVSETVKKAVEADGNVRLVLKEFPILGADSLYAARAALAATRQDGYEAFHYALMEAPEKVDREAVLAIAREQGLDVERLQQDMQDEAIDAELRRNYRLAEALEINGTPAFVVGDELVPGAIDRARLESLVAEARRGEG